MDTAAFQTKLAGVVEWLSREYVGIRTGQAAPALLDSVRVEHYGSLMPLNQIGSVSIEDARTLRISTWDTGVIPAAERALKEADLGVSVVTDSNGLRVIFPELTSERRTQLLKLAKQKLEEARVSVRGVRDEMMKSLDRRQKDGELSEDDKFTAREQAQKQVEATNEKLDATYAQKEREMNA